MSFLQIAAPLCVLAIGTACVPDKDTAAANVNPEAAITSHSDGDTVSANDSVTLVGTVSDGDHDVSDLIADWYGGDRLLCEAVVPGTNREVSCDAVLDSEEIDIALVVSDPEGATGTANVSLAWGTSTAPDATIDSPTAEGSYTADAPIPFAGSVSDAEDDVADLVVWWHSDLQGDLDLAATPDADGHVTGDLELEAGDHRITLHVEDPDGNAGSAIVDITVDPGNTAPSCTITDPAKGGMAEEGDVVSFTGQVSDLETDPDALDLTWSSDLDGELSTDPAQPDGTTTFTTSTLSVGPHAITLSASDGMSACSSTVEFLVGQPPELIIDLPGDGEVFNEGDAVDFSATVADDRTAPEDLGIEWTSDLDGLLDTGPADPTGLTAFVTSTLSIGDHLITLEAHDIDGLVSTASIVVSINDLPGPPTIEITPDPATTEDDLVAEITADSADAEGDSVTYSYAWYQDGVLVVDATTDTVDSGLTARDEEWTVEVTPHDGFGFGDVATAILTVANTPPVLTDVTLSPDPAYEGDMLTCGVGTAFDADADGIGYAFAWTVDGSTIGAISPALDDTWFVGGNDVACIVTPNDGTDDGAPVVSNTVTIANSAPSISSVAIGPDDPRADDTLTCSYTGFSDPDGDADASAIRWTVDGVEVGTSPDLAGAFAAGDEVFCTVTPSDGVADGTPVSASITILNTRPVLASAAINPDPATETDLLTCTPGSATDTDGDSIGYAFAWTVSGSDAGTASTLDGTSFDKGDTVVCTVTPNDGTEDGDPVDTPTLTIVNTPPTLDGVTITPDPVFEGDTLACMPGATTDADVDDVTLSYAWTVNGTPTGTSDATLSDGYWASGDSVVCTVTPADDEEDGLPVDSAVVVVGNATPSIASVSIWPESPMASDTLDCSWSGFSDDDGDPDLSTVSWTIEGVEVGTSTSLAGVFDVGQTVTCTVTPRDGITTGAPVSASVSIGNNAPVLTDASLTPDPAYEGDTLTCTPGAASDADGHSVTFRYAWTVDGAIVGATDATLSSAWFDKGQDVRCDVTPDDGLSLGTPVASNTVTIANTAPILTDAMLTPDPAIEGDTLTCRPGAASDADADAVTFSYRWTVAGSDTGTSDDTLGDDAWAKGDEVTCTITPYDGEEDGAPVVSNPVVIGNSAPTVTSVAIDPPAPTASDTLTCSWSFDDIDGDADLSTVQWVLNGAEVGTGTTYAGALAGGDVVTCTVTPYDGEDAGTADSHSVTVGNTLPVLDSVALNPDPAFEGDVFTCSAGTATDDDGDPINFTYQWTVNGADPRVEDPTLDSSEFSKNQSVSCIVTPHDPFGSGTPIESNVVLVSNTPPVLTNAILGPDPAYEGDTLTCTPGDASDVDGDWITYRYTWNVSGTTIAATTDTLDDTQWAKTDTVSCTIVPEDGDEDGEPVTSPTVTVVNTPPVVSAVSISPSAPSSGDSLTCTWDYTDVDGDAEQSVPVWSVNGIDVGSGSTYAGKLSGGDLVACTVVGDDGEDLGNTGVDSVVVGNTPPTVASASLSPDPAYESSTLTCTAGATDDPDGDPVTLSYAWSVDGSDPGVYGPALGGADFDRGQEVTCLVTPNDGLTNGSTATSNAVTISNTAPVMDSVALTPVTPVEGDTLECDSTATDDDDDDITYTYAWTVAGIPASGTSSTLGGGSWAKGDEVTCTATPDDGTDTGTGMTSSPVTIGNATPTVANVSITPGSPRVGEDVTCDYTFTDLDGDADASTITWTVNGLGAGSGRTLSGAFVGGDTIECTVTAFDGDDTGNSASGSVTAANSGPVITSVSISPDPAAYGDTLTCSHTATDPDGDTLTSTYEWTIDGASASTSSTLASGFDGADVVVCTVTVDDGEQSAVDSVQLTIDNTPPAMTSVSLTPPSPAEGDTLTCSGSGTDVDGDSLTYTYAWTVNGGTIPPTTTTLDDTHWAKGDEVLCTVTPDDGMHAGSPMSSSIVTVDNTPPQVSNVAINPANPVTGDALQCSWEFSDADGDADASTVQWTVGGSVVGSGTSLASGFVGGDTITCTVSAHDGEEAGNSDSQSVTAGNSAPVVLSVAIDPDPAVVGDTLACNYSASDPDGESLGTTFTWTVNDEVIGTSDTLPSGFVGGDEVACTVTVDDGMDSDSGSAALTIGNTAPILTSVTLTPEAPVEGDTLRCEPSGSDADGQTVTYTYEWTVDGVSLADSGPTLGDDSWHKGDDVTCTVTPSDDVTQGDPMTSNEVTIDNTAPDVTGVSISPASATVGEDLLCTYSFEDADEDADRSTIEWTVGGAVVGTTASLSSGFVGGDTVTCAVTAFDGEDTGNASTASLTIDNTPPVVTAVTISPPSAQTGTTLLCSYSASDLDGDSLSESYAWTLDGVTIGSTSSLSTGFVGGDDVTCTVTVDDGRATASGLARITIDNTEPVITSVNLTPMSPVEGDLLTCSASATDDDGEEPSIGYAWTVSSVTVPGQSGSTLTDSHWAKHDTVSCTVTPSDSSGPASSATSNTVTVDNTTPVVANVQVSPSSPQVGDTLTCGYDFSDADGDLDNSSITWTVGGAVVGTSRTLSSGFTGGDTITCAVDAHDGEEAGNSGSHSVTVGNTTPVVSSVTITPPQAVTGDNLSCTYTATDADADPLTPTYSWTVNGLVIGSSSTVSTGFFGGDEVVCTVTVSDGFSSAFASDSLVIDNTDPVVTSVTITPPSATVGDDLTCNYTATDADADSLTPTYAWSVNGVESGTGTTLSSGFTGGDQVSCTVTVDDGNGSDSGSDSLVIDNTAPVITSVSIAPSAPVAGDRLVCSYVASDADGDNLEPVYEWLVNGNPSGTSSTLSGGFSGGDTVVCSVIVSDGIDSDTGSASVSVSNSTPTISNVGITPLGATISDALTCGWAYSDPDGDSDQSTVAWTLDGNTIGTSPTLSSGYVGGDRVTCTVTAYDGTNTGNSSSDTITIANTAPEITSVSVGPVGAVTGDTLTCDYTATDEDGDSLNPTYSWTVGGVDAGNGSTLSSGFTGGDLVVCTVTVSDGADSASDSASTIIDNTDPVLASVEIHPVGARAGDLLTCTYSATDVDGDTLTPTYAWTINGTDAGSDSTLFSGFVGGDLVACSVQVDDGVTSDSGSASTVIQNTSPTVSDVIISPVNPVAGEDLSCSYIYTDPDEDPDQSTYAWTVGDVVVSTSSTYEGGVKGEVITCTVIGYDGEDYGNSASDSVTVANTPPRMVSVEVTPAPGSVLDTFTCTPTSTDADDDQISHTYSWWVTEREIGVTDSRLPPGYTTKGDTVMCRVVPSDGTDSGESMFSVPVDVLNSPPTVTSLDLSPSSPFDTNSVITATATVDDPDMDPVDVTIDWYVSGSWVGSGTSLDGRTDFDKHHSVYAIATPHDGTIHGSPVTSATLTIPNSLPTAPVVTTYPEYFDGKEDEIYCAIDAESYDVDGDSIRYTLRWKTDLGQIYPDDFPSAIGPTTTTHSGDTVPAPDTTLASAFTCSVVPDDGEDYGAEAQSTSYRAGPIPTGHDEYDPAGGGFSLSGAPYVYAEPTRVDVDATVTTFAFYCARDCGGNIQIFLYTDDGGLPNKLLAQSEIMPIINGVNIVPPKSPFSIGAGDYQIAVIHDAPRVTIGYTTYGGEVLWTLGDRVDPFNPIATDWLRPIAVWMEGY